MTRKVLCRGMDLHGGGGETVSYSELQAAHDRWFKAQVQLGLEDLEAGRIVPGDVVEAEFASIRAMTTGEDQPLAHPIRKP